MLFLCGGWGGEEACPPPSPNTSLLRIVCDILHSWILGGDVNWFDLQSLFSFLRTLCHYLCIFANIFAQILSSFPKQILLISILHENISFLISFISFYQLFFLISFISFYQLFANITEKNCVWVPSAHPSTCDSVMFLLPFCQLVCTVCILMLSLPILQCVCTQICLGNKIGGILSVWGCSGKWGGGKCLDPPLL